MTTTCSTRNVEFVTKELGADAAIDYTQARCGACLATAWWGRAGGWHHGQQRPAAAAGAPCRPPRARLSWCTPLPLRLQGPWDAAAAAAGQRFDLVVDTIGGPYEAASLRLVAPGGSLAALGATGPGVDRVSVWGMARLLLGAGWRTLAGKLRLAPRYTL